MVALNNFCDPRIWTFVNNGEYVQTRGIIRKRTTLRGQPLQGMLCDVFIGLVPTLRPNGGYCIKIMLQPYQQLIENKICTSKVDIEKTLGRFGLGYLVN